MRMEYMKVPLNKYTFKAKKIRQWVERNCGDVVLNVFAGTVELDVPTEIRNDIRRDGPKGCHFHVDAADLPAVIAKERPDLLFDTVVLDPLIVTENQWRCIKGLV
jgi:hypothetical protein